jgi:hypothetical protein
LRRGRGCDHDGDRLGGGLGDNLFDHPGGLPGDLFFYLPGDLVHHVVFSGANHAE